MSLLRWFSDPEFYGAVLAILGCLGILYLFFTVLVHVIRRKDMSGGWKAFWLIVLFVVPPVAMIAYLAYQFQTYVIGQKQDDATAANSQARHGFERTTAFSSAEEIERLNELKQRGLITNEEFAVLRSKLFK